VYKKFYGFSEKPFEVTPDPKFLYFTSSHRDALAAVFDAITNRQRFISLIGEAGTGKTTLIHFLLGRLDPKVKTAFIGHPPITFRDLLRNVFLELSFNVVEENNKVLLIRLNEYLEELAVGQTLAVIIDEAQNLPEQVIEELGRLEERIALTSSRLQIIFVGQPEFESKLNSPVLRELNQRIGIRRQIRAFAEEESRAYIDHRLKLVGSSSSEIFTPNALSTILIHAKGIPRVINILCDRAFLIGYGFSTKRIDAEIIGKTINEMESPILPKSVPTKIIPALKGTHWRFLRVNFPQRRISFAILSILCLGASLLLIYGFLQQKPTKTGSIESITNRRIGALEEVIAVENGQTISSLSQKYYRMTNPTLLAFILDFNPEITNADLIQVNQKIKIPKITNEGLVFQSSDRVYKIHVGTFLTLDFVKPYKNEPLLKGKKIEVLPRKVSPQDTWYRVEVGNFDHKDEALKMIDLLKEKRLLPLFGDNPKIE
jgi:general secretion pathway protein A